MRVAIVSDYFPPVAPGGAEVSAAYLAKALFEHIDVEVVTTDFGLRPQLPFIVHYVPLAGIPTDGSAASDPRAQFDGRVRPFSKSIHYAQFSTKLASLARSREFDVVHTQQNGAEIAAYLSSPLHRRPRLTTLRGYGHLAGKWQDDAASLHGLPQPAPGTGFVSRWKRKVPRSALRSNAHVFTVSEFVRDAHVRHGAIEASASSALFNIAPSEEPSAEDFAKAREVLEGMNGPIALFAGRLTVGKGLEMLVDALPTLIRRVPEARLVIAGGGDSTALKERANARMSGYAAKFTGHIENGVTLALMRMAQVVVVPSLHHEPLGRVLIEAIAAGKLIVATPYGGTPEVITHGENGLLIDPVDAECLGQTLARALSGSGLQERARKFNAELLRERLNPARTVEATLDAYDRARAA